MEKYSYIKEENLDDTFCNRDDCSYTTCAKHPINIQYKMATFPSPIQRKDLAYSDLCHREK